MKKTAVIALLAAAAGASAQPLTTAFTYQGQLLDGGKPANGLYDLSFRLYTSKDALFSIGPLEFKDDVQVINGLFTVTLDFGDVYRSEERWLQIWVRPGDTTGASTALAPRQQLTAAPAAADLVLPFVTHADSGLSLIDVTHTGDAGRAGTFSIDNPDSPHIALFAETTGTGHAVQGYARGDGAKGVGGYNNAASGEAGYFRIGHEGNRSPALLAQTQGPGAAVLADSAGGSAVVARSNGGPALDVADGYLRVQNAGVFTSTPVFIHQVTFTNLVTNYRTRIDHPLCNGKPNAILLITEVDRRSDDEFAIKPRPLAVKYITSDGRWEIISYGNATQEDQDIDVNERFNIMVILP